jgi:class 3 adenylate cyclase/tetratricopeptide (TPR) repeat protein
VQPHRSVCSSRIGRDDEFVALSAHVAQVTTNGTGQLVLVSGEAGVGKSRLVADAVRFAHDAGLATLTGECAPGATIPYSPFVHAIRRATRTLGPQEIGALFDGSAMLAAALLPEVAAAIELPEANPHPEDVSAAVWHLLARLCRPSGGLLLLEDLHWADPDSLRLVSDLARELDDLPVCIVATYRPDELHRRHPLTAMLAELGRERRYDEVVLAPLRSEDIGLMLTEIFDGSEVSDDFTDLVVKRTGGNPFFVEELAKVLVDSGDVYHSGHAWERRDLDEIQMPVTVRETLLTRARALDARSLELLQLAALASDRLDLAVLAEATGADRDALEDVVREGLRLQLLSEVRDGATTAYVFRHALTREALGDELVGPDRRRAHQMLASAIATVHADELDSFAAELADHFETAQEGASALTFALRAARAAAAAFAGDEADRRFDQALRLMTPTDERRLAVLLEASGRLTTSAVSRMRVAFATEARSLAASRGDAVSEADALLILERDRWYSGDGPGAIELVEQALELVRGRDDYTEAWVLHRLARLLRLGDRIPEAEELLAVGIDIAQRSGNESALSGLYGTQMMTATYGQSLRDSHAAALRAARAGGDLDTELNVQTNAGFIYLWCGDLGESGHGFERACDLAARIAPNDHYLDAGFAWMLALAGRYSEAERLSQPLRSDAKIPTQIVALTALCEVAERRGASEFGDLAGELLAAGMVAGETQRSVPALSVGARLALARDGVDVAIPLFWQAARTTAAGYVHASHWLFSPDLARALAEEGRTQELADWCEYVRELSERDPTPHNVVAGQLCDAYLHLARGERDQAREAFAQSARTYHEMPCPAREIESLLGLASAYGAEDAASAVDTARSALVIAEGIGAPTLAVRARVILQWLEASPVLATILMTDIVESTALAAQLGDREWTELLGRHHSIVRRELARAHGRELDTAGDGFLVAFELPAQAIHCAVSIREALATAGIRIRAGLHTGECHEADGKLTGLAVHIAARVAAVALPGEILVSSTVRELVAGSGITFDSRGSHVLKGIPDEWRLFAVAGS